MNASISTSANFTLLAIAAILHLMYSPNSNSKSARVADMLQQVREHIDRIFARRGHNVRILSALASVVGWIALAKVAGAAKEVAVAARYGISPAVDAYVFVFNVVSWPVVVSLSVFTIVVLPILIRSGQEDPRQMRLFRREILGVTIAISVVTAAVLGSVLLAAFHWNVLRLSLPVVASASNILLPMLLVVTFGLLNSFLAVRLMAQFKHLNSLLEGVPALVIFLFIAITPPTTTLWPLVWGTAVGAVVQCTLLVLAQGRSDPLELPRFGLTSSIWPSVLKGFSLIAASQAILSLSDVIDQVMVAHVGVGSNATLGYANRLLALLLGLGATGITRALLPVLSDLRQQGDVVARTVATHWMGYLFFAGAAAAAISWILTPWAVHLLFQRGAFNAANTYAVSGVVRAGLLQLPIYFAGIVLVQLTASRADYIVFFYVNLSNIGVKIVGNYFLIGRYGVEGAMYSSTLVYVIATMLLFVLSRRAFSTASPKT